ncbi:MAG: hypothetical protein ABSG01_17050 [Anaerolineales bacterium]
MLHLCLLSRTSFACPCACVTGAGTGRAGAGCLAMLTIAHFVCSGCRWHTEQPYDRKEKGANYARPALCGARTENTVHVKEIIRVINA